MKFSHDTLLHYSEKLFDSYPVLVQIVVDKYPYIFVDEYQDTNEKVIAILSKLFQVAEAKSKQWLVGYFGDTAQNIYDDGVGSKIDDIHPKIESIDKIFNRRSHIQIITVANKIRNDNIQQKPIDESKNAGHVEFYHSTSVLQEQITTDFLNQYAYDISQDQYCTDKRIHCLVLTNKLVAELSGFKDIHAAITNADATYWKDINTKLLSHDTEKLYPAMLLVYRILKLNRYFSDKQATYQNIFGKLKEKIRFYEAHRLFKSIQKVEANTLNEVIQSLSNVINNVDYSDQIRRNLINSLPVKYDDIKQSSSFYSYVKNELHLLMAGDNDTTQNQEEQIAPEDELMNITIQQWDRWINFIDRQNEDQDIIFHTYHGTKGEEYENVAIVMEHSFGGGWPGRDKFKNYFIEFANNNCTAPSGEQSEQGNSNFELENTKNLIYVACSRAIRHLRVLYLDDITEIKDGIESIFGEVKQWPT